MSKVNSQINQNFEKWPKNTQTNLIAGVNLLDIGFISKHIINLGKGGMGGYSVSVNYQSLVLKFFPLAPPQLFFSIKYRRNRLLCVSFLEL